jgi:hypothetical protein
MAETSEPGRAGTLVIRAWVEAPDHALKARLTSASDVGPEATIRAVASVDDLVAEVRAWADRLLEPIQPSPNRELESGDTRS